MTNPPASVFIQDSAARALFERITGKWAALIVYALDERTKRFSELQREIEGVSQRMLSYTLKDLEAAGIISRKQYPTVPPKTEYTLTPVGATLVEPLRALCHWCEANQGDVKRSRQVQ